MSEVDRERLRALAAEPGALEELELDGPDETAETWQLGNVAIEHDAPRFRFGYTAPLTDRSHFRKLPFDLPEQGRRGIAAVLHVDGDHEYLAGWVPPDREVDLEAWLAFLNGHLYEVVHHGHDPEHLYGAGRESAEDEDGS